MSCWRGETGGLLCSLWRELEEATPSSVKSIPSLLFGRRSLPLYAEGRKARCGLSFVWLHTLDGKADEQQGSW